ncbi:hypothetical protein VNI00_014468 [Paramarasmius palmivorus]|uniref:Uncharacterized protein n=1 Tax=Paramarasmius palmivorus TaxID=297713 RepID=A0AAW0BS40_9AGAR
MSPQSYSRVSNDPYANFESYFDRMTTHQSGSERRAQGSENSSPASTIKIPSRAVTASPSPDNVVRRHSPNNSESRLPYTRRLSVGSDTPKPFHVDGADPPNLGSGAETVALLTNPVWNNGHMEAVNTQSIPSRSTSSRTFISSPLNPSSSPQSQSPPETPFGKVYDTFGNTAVARLPSEEARALGHRSRASRSSMILYRLVDISDDEGLQSPPRLSGSDGHRASIASSSGETVVSVSSDSKYPSLGASERGMVAYAYDPALDTDVEADDDDWNKEDLEVGSRSVSARGLRNTAALFLVLLLAIGLFIVLPLTYHAHKYSSELITHNPFINSTGQAVDTVLQVRRDDSFIFLR